MFIFVYYFVYLFVISCINADIYLHNPRGSNNRLAEANNERTNANRLFDSENNNRGGYNVGYMYYYVGSKLQIEWTNQHSCNNPNSNCDLIIQYMCSDLLRDGSKTNTIPTSNANCDKNDCNNDSSYGMHENYDYYKTCSRRARNTGIFIADQKVGPTAMNTRQNPNGQISGYECSEEHPYFQPSPWIDIAVLTNDASRCSYFQSESENVKSRWYCAVPQGFIQNSNQLIPINQVDCEKLIYNNASGVWTESPAHGVDPPVCKETEFTRDNHLGNTNGVVNPPLYNWTIPNNVNENCALRIRYNISTNDYNQNVDSSSNGSPITKIPINENVGLDLTSAQSRGYVFKNNPTIRMFSDLNFTLNLAINTAQYGRVFQDRSHRFSIKPRTSIPSDADILNLNVRGKRGNIVQVYPAVEYDFVPNTLEISINDFIHYQWTGSNTNDNGNDGQGTAGSDRNNIVVLSQRPFASTSYSIYDPLEVVGDMAVNYPNVISNITNSIIPSNVLKNLATLKTDSNAGFSATLNDASPYYDINAVKVNDTGVIQYMCTRNNAFSNRDQKGAIIVVDYQFDSDTFGVNGGVLSFSDGELDVPKKAFNKLTYVRVDVLTLDQIQVNPEFQNMNSNFNSKNVDSKFLRLNPLNMNSNTPLTVKMKTFDGSSSASVYRLSPDFLLMTKVASNLENGYQVFQVSSGGTYVARVETNFGLIIGVVIGVVIFLVIAMVITVVLVKNPKYISSWRNRARYAKRSMFNKV